MTETLFIFFVHTWNVLCELCWTPLRVGIHAYKATVVSFLRFLYLHSPKYMGGWAGLPKEDICASMTDTGSRTWANRMDFCVEEIERHFVATAIAVHVVAMTVAVVAMWQFTSHAIYSRWVVRAVMRDAVQELHGVLHAQCNAQRIQWADRR